MPEPVPLCLDVSPGGECACVRPVPCDGDPHCCWCGMTWGERPRREWGVVAKRFRQVRLG